MSFIQTWGSVIGPVVAGAIYDGTRSYTLLLWGSLGLLSVTGCLYAMVLKPSPTAKTNAAV